MLGVSPAKQLWLLSENRGREVSETSGDRWEQTLPEALAAFWALLQNSSLMEQDVPVLLAEEEGLFPSHLHVLPCCDSGEQFPLINVSASAVPPVPFSVLTLSEVKLTLLQRGQQRVICKETGKNLSYSQKQTVCCQETGIRALGIPFKPCISKLRYHLFWDDTHWIPLLQSRYRKTENENSWMILITCSYNCLDTICGIH